RNRNTHASPTRRSSDLIKESTAMANNNSGRDKNEKDLVCSFCGKHQDEVERMIIGPGVNICSECIGLCYDLLAEKPDRSSGSRRSEEHTSELQSRIDLV